MKRYADLHTHLYGCVTPEDISQWGQTHGVDAERMQWFAREFNAAEGRLPDWSLYFSSSAGVELIKQDYPLLILILGKQINIIPEQVAYIMMVYPKWK